MSISAEVKKAWVSTPPLTFVAILNLVLFVPCVAGIFLDSRIITGVPAWLKPAKFAISTAIYTGSLAWLYRYLNVWPRFLRGMAWVTSLVLVFEIGPIVVQAARGTTSHFNVSTPLDGAIFAGMGAMIALLWLASVGILVAALRQTFQNPAWGWSLRLGLLTTVLGSALGGVMIRATPEQAEELRHHHSVKAVGAHTIGAPDGGPGIPGVGWSTEHGDGRIPHFFGIHGLQIIPFLGWLLSRRRDGEHVRLIFAIASSYLAFVAILAWQALRGQSILEPDPATLLTFSIWLVATLATVFALRRTPVEALA